MVNSLSRLHRETDLAFEVGDTLESGRVVGLHGGQVPPGHVDADLAGEPVEIPVDRVERDAALGQVCPDLLLRPVVDREPVPNRALAVGQPLVARQLRPLGPGRALFGPKAHAVDDQRVGDVAPDPGLDRVALQVAGALALAGGREFAPLSHHREEVFVGVADDVEGQPEAGDERAVPFFGVVVLPTCVREDDVLREARVVLAQVGEHR